MRRHAKRFSQVGLNRKRKLEEIQGPPELKVFDFVQSLKKSNPQEMLQQHQAMMRANMRAIVQSQQPQQQVRNRTGTQNPTDVLKTHTYVNNFDQTFNFVHTKLRF